MLKSIISLKTRLTNLTSVWQRNVAWKHLRFMKCFKRHTHTRRSPCYTMKRYLSSLCLYYRGRCLMWVPAFLSHCRLSHQRLEAWAAEWRREAPLFLFFFSLLWMLSLIMNECNSGKCASWTVKETPKSSRAPEGICLWQTTSPREENRARWVPQIKRLKARAYAPPSRRFFLLLWFLDFNLKVKGWMKNSRLMLT